MNDAAIALNRFGLGGRSDEQPPAQPRVWPTQQLSRYDQRPAPIAAALLRCWPRALPLPGPRPSADWS